MQRPGFVELDIDIINNDPQRKIFLAKAGEQNPPSRLHSNGQSAIAQARPDSIGLWCGYFEGSVESKDGGLVLGPQSTLGMVLRFNWDQPMQGENAYPWELEVGGLYLTGSDQALPQLRHGYP